MGTEGNDMEQLKRDVADIKRALLGSDAYQEEGLLHRVTTLESWKESLTIKIAGVMGGAVVAAWLIGKFVDKL
jgi:hypothetical protein